MPSSLSKYPGMCCVLPWKREQCNIPSFVNLSYFHKLSVKDHHSILGLTIWLSHTSGLKCSLAFFPGFWLREEVNDFLLILLPLQHSFILLSFKCFEGGIFLLVLGWGKHSLALLADSHDALTKLDKHRRHVDIHVELIVASQPNVNGRDLDGLAPLAQMVELLPYQPARLDGSVHSQGVVDLGGPGLSSQVGLVTVDQAPVAVVITGLACVAQ